MFGRCIRPHCGIGVEERAGPDGIELAFGVNAPVIDGNRDVVEQGIGAGEIKINDAGHGGAGKQHVVAKQVGVDGPARQFGRPRGVLQRHFLLQQRSLMRRQEGQDFRQHGGPPLRSARIGHGRRIRLAGEVQFCHDGADRGALHGCRLAHITAFQSRDQCRWFAVQLAEVLMGAIGHRTGAGHAAAGEMGHQVQVKR